MNSTRFFVYSLLILLNACAQQAQSQAQSQASNTPPTWLQKIINEDGKKPLNNAVQEVWKISHQGNVAYFVVSPCCDQFNSLYDASGTQLCSPTGGIVGRGDGKCPTPADVGSKPILIWSHPQSQIKNHDASYLISDKPKDNDGNLK